MTGQAERLDARRETTVVQHSGIGIVCPRCKNVMIYQMETEITGEQKIIRRYYKCTVCGYRIDDLSAMSSNGNGRIRITVKWLREWGRSKTTLVAISRNGNTYYLKT